MKFIKLWQSDKTRFDILKMEFGFTSAELFRFLLLSLNLKRYRKSQYPFLFNQRYFNPKYQPLKTVKIYKYDYERRFVRLKIRIWKEYRQNRTYNDMVTYLLDAYYGVLPPLPPAVKKKRHRWKRKIK